MIVYQNDENFSILPNVPEIFSFKHHEIQEFAKNYHISAMKINKGLFFLFFLILARTGACSTKILSFLNLCDTISKFIL
jgi:hypothetical protein